MVCLAVLALPLVSVHSLEAGKGAAAPGTQPEFRMIPDKGPVKVPFELYGDGILVKARLNGSRSVLLSLDTGASLNVINTRLFSQLGLKNQGAGTMAGGGGVSQGQLVQNATVTLPGLDVYKQVIVSAPLDPMATMGRDVGGLIGTIFLKNFVVEINYTDKVITFYDPKVHNLSNEPGAIPMEGRDGLPYVPIELSLNGHDKISSQFMVDTGSNRVAHFSKPFADEHKVLSVVPKSKTTDGLGEAIGGSVHFTEARIAYIKIGNRTIRNPIVSISENTEGLQSEPGSTGILGAELLRRFTLVLDYSSSKMLLKPNAWIDEPYEVDMSGLELETRLDNAHVFLIKAVLPNYPAAEAGLHEGDEIVAVDTRPASDLDLDQIVRMFKKPSKTYVLLIKRRDQQLKVSLRMKRVI